MNFLQDLAEAPLSIWVMQSSWGYYILLAIHGIGMAAVVGSTFMLCVRVLGLGKGIVVADLGDLKRVAWGGFVINLISGVILFCGSAPQMAINATFQYKMISLVLGGIALWLLWRMVNQSQGREEPDFSFSAGIKVVALVTFAFWTGAIIFGRDIAYTLEPIMPVF
jgi:hypothetical protein